MKHMWGFYPYDENTNKLFVMCYTEYDVKNVFSSQICMLLKDFIQGNSKDAHDGVSSGKCKVVIF